MKSATIYRLKLAVAGGLAVVTAAGAGMAALALSRPEAAAGFAGDLAQVHEARAGRATGAEAETRTRAALAQAPLNAAHWARLAYLDRETSATMGPKALDALDRSYAVAPHGPDITAWRLRFAFEHWPELTPTLREQAMDEMRVLARHRPRAARELARTIQASGGRMAARMTLSIGEGEARIAREAKIRDAESKASG